MPRYSLNYQGQTYTVESPTELNNQQVLDKFATDFRAGKYNTSNAALGSGRAIANTLTAGQAPHISGFYDALGAAVYNKLHGKENSAKEFYQDYVKGREDFKKEQKQFEKEHPALNLGSEIVGFLAPGGVTSKGLSSLIKANKVLNASKLVNNPVTKTAIEGSLFGGGYGASNTERKGFDPMGAILGTAGGAVMAPVFLGGTKLAQLGLKGVGKGIKSIYDMFLSKNKGRVGDYIRPAGITEHSMEHIVNDPEVAREVAQGGIGKKAENLIENAQNSFDTTKQKIDTEIKNAYSGITDDTLVSLNKTNDTINQMERIVNNYEKIAGKDPEAQKAIAKAREKIEILKDEVQENFEKELIDNAYKDVKVNPLKGDRIGKDEILAEIIPDNLNTYVINRGAAIKDKAGNIIVQGKELERLTGTKGNFGFSKMIFKHDLTLDEIGKLPRILREYKPSSVRPDGNLNWRVPLDDKHNMIISFAEKGKNRLKEITVHKETIKKNKTYNMSQKRNYNPGELLGRSVPDTAQTVGKPSAESVVPNSIIGNKFNNVNKNIDFGKLKYHIDDINTIIDSMYKDLPTGGQKRIRPQSEIDMFQNMVNQLRQARDSHSPQLQKATEFYSDMKKLNEEFAKINPKGLYGEDKIGKSAAKLNKDTSGGIFKLAEQNIRKILNKYPQLEGTEKVLTDLKKAQVSTNIKPDENYATNTTWSKLLNHIVKGGNRDQQMQQFAKAILDGKITKEMLNREFRKARNIPIFSDIINYYLATSKVPQVNSLSNLANNVLKGTKGSADLLRQINLLNKMSNTKYALPKITIKKILDKYYNKEQ